MPCVYPQGRRGVERGAFPVWRGRPATAETLLLYLVGRAWVAREKVTKGACLWTHLDSCR